MSSLLSSIILPIPLHEGQEVELALEYEGLSIQCIDCVGVDHTLVDCKNQPMSKSKGQVKLQKGK